MLRNNGKQGNKYTLYFHRAYINLFTILGGKIMPSDRTEYIKTETTKNSLQYFGWISSYKTNGVELEQITSS